MSIRRLAGPVSIFLFLLFTPAVVMAQLFGISDNDPRWGDWRSAPNFPGIEIRVACGTYVPSTGDAQWSFQFRNAYPQKVYLVYQEEASDSTGKPPTFSSPGGRNLASGEKSDMYTDYLHGTCAARKQIFIKVNSISDDEGNQTKAEAGASQTSALSGASPAQSKPSKDDSGNSASADRVLPASGAPTNVVSQTSDPASTRNSIVGTWTCTFLRRYPDGAGQTSTATDTFNPDGTWYSSSSPDQNIWSQDGLNLVVHAKGREDNGFATPWTGQATDSSHLTLTSNSLVDAGVDSLTCQR